MGKIFTRKFLDMLIPRNEFVKCCGFDFVKISWCREKAMAWFFVDTKFRDKDSRTYPQYQPFCARHYEEAKIMTRILQGNLEEIKR